MKTVAKFTLLCVAFCFANAARDFCVGAEDAETRKQMNVIFFLVDDLGWADIGANGSTFYETPNIDALSESGMRFTQAYAACPVCSPTRASIMTGRHPVRVDITDWIPGQTPNASRGDKFRLVPDRDNLALDEITIAELLKDNGYQTFFAGKWHLGSRGHWPTDQGFEINIGGHEKGSPPGGYYAPWTNPVLEAKEEGEYLTERLTEESIKFLDERDEDRPFLLYLSFYNVHTPIQAYRKRVEHYEAKAKEWFPEDAPAPIEEHEGITRTRQDNAAYASMVQAVDDSVGAILDRLEELEIDEETAIFFFSDNGGLSTLRRLGPTCNLPLRAGKGWLYEGGVREPCLVRVPGMTAEGSVCETPMVSMDFFPTILELAGIEARTDLHADGESLVGLLKGDEGESRTFYWHYPHYHGSTWKPGASIRDGDWKLIEFYHWDKIELYNLADDPGEQNELSEQEPEIAKRLQDKLRAWQNEMNARMPEPFE